MEITVCWRDGACFWLRCLRLLPLLLDRGVETPSAVVFLDAFSFD